VLALAIPALLRYDAKAAAHVIRGVSCAKRG
jgi:hypothetical protein